MSDNPPEDSTDREQIPPDDERDDTHAAEYREEDARAARRMADMRDGGVSGEDGE